MGENVRGLVNWNGGLVFEEVQAELEAEGYEVQPFLLPACGVNAPHRRDRIWFVAHTNFKPKLHKSDNGVDKESIREQGQEAGESNGKTNGGVDSNTFCEGLQGKDDSGEENKQGRGREELRGELAEHSGENDVTNTPSSGRGQDNEQFKPRESKYACASWDSWPTQSPLCYGDDGLSSELDGITFPKWRSESIKAGGNAIVPQVAIQIFKAIEQYELRTK